MALRRGEAAIAFLVAATLDVVAGLRAAPGVRDGDLVNPDSYMRLVRLRDIVAAASPLHVVARDGSGDGAVLHWSHFLDSLLLILALPFGGTSDWALRMAGLVSGPLAIGLTGVAVVWMTAPLAVGGMRLMAAAMVGLTPSVIAYGVPGVVHHHVLLGTMAVLVAGAAGRVAAGEWRQGVLLGTASAAGIWLSPETMPFVLMGFAGGGVGWLAGRDRDAVAAGLALAGTVFLVLTAAIVAVDPGIGRFEIDRVSLAYVVLAAITAGVGWWIALVGRFVIPLAVAAIVLWVGCFPQILAGADGVVDAAASKAILAATKEMMPVDSVLQAVTFLGGSVLAFGVALWLAVIRRSWTFAYAALCAAVMLGLGGLHVRFSTYGALAGAAALPVAIAEIGRWMHGRSQVYGRIGLILAAVLATRADTLAAMMGAAPKPEGVTTPGCNLHGAAQLLGPFGDAIVLSDPNDVPELLYRTGVRTVAGLYHRNVVPEGRMWAAWRAVPGDTVGPEFLATRASLVLLCPHEGRPSLVDGLPKTTLLDRLFAADPPPWLQRVGADPGSNYVLYRVVESGSR